MSLVFEISLNTKDETEKKKKEDKDENNDKKERAIQARLF